MSNHFVEAAHSFADSEYGRFLLSRASRGSKTALRLAWMRGAYWQRIREIPDKPCKAAAPGWLKGRP